MKKCCMIILSCLIHFFASAQNYPTPNAASFGVFGVYPQTGFTGVPAISIPVYNMEYEGMSVPISLEYNPNLVKPNIYSSWVGMGWNLSVGGLVSRVINGHPDDANIVNQIIYGITSEQQSGFFYNHSYLAASDWATNHSRFLDAMLDNQNYDYDHVSNDFETIKDYSPDEYFFSVGNISGYFFMDQNGNWKVRSDEKVKIEINNSDLIYTKLDAFIQTPPPQTSIQRINIIDSKGIRYVFGGAENTIERSMGQKKSWYLTTIKFPNGKKINYEYENGLDIVEDPFTGGNPNLASNYTTTFTKPVYIKKITTEVLEIQFNRSSKTGEYSKLDEIIVKRIGDTGFLLKKAFTYANTPMNKLTLLYLSEKGSDNDDGGVYKFEYNSEFPYTTPSTWNYRNTDHWGFYNSKPLAYNTTYAAVLASREPDTANCSLAMLNKVIYPTKGYTKYIWGPHSYAKEVKPVRSDALLSNSTDKNAGGVRIKEISNYDADNVRIGRKRYAYTTNYSLSNPNGRSSGVLNYLSYLKNGDSAMIVPSMALAESNIGAHIQYSEVTEINDDSSFTITKYSNFDTGTGSEYMDEAPLHIFNTNQTTTTYSSNGHERGRPLSVKSYNSSGILVHEKTIEYQRIDKANQFARSYVFSSYRLPSVTPKIWSGSAIKMYTNSYLPSKETTVKYDIAGLNPITSEVLYTYDNESRLTKTASSDGLGGYNTSELVYSNALVSLGNIYEKMTDANIKLPIETRTYSEPSGQPKILTGATLNTYNNSNPYQLILPDKTYNYFPDPSNPGANSLITTTASSVGATFDSKYVKVSSNDYYNKLGKLIQIKQGEAPVSGIQWRYDNNYVNAQVTNAQNSYNAYDVLAVQSGTLNAEFGLVKSTSFTTYFDGDVTISIQLTSAPTTHFVMTCNLFNANNYYNQNLCFEYGTSCGPSGVSTFTFKNVPAGTYTLEAILDRAAYAGVNYSYNGKTTATSGIKEFYYQDFEEPGSGSPGSGTAHTGKGYHALSYYTLNWTKPTARDYVYSYWYLQSGEWKFTGELPYINNSYNLVGSGFDDIRIYPKDAQMINYAYDDLIGLSSTTDSKGVTSYYEYDNFQRLKNIKDDKGNIVKNFTYNLLPTTIYSNIVQSQSFTKACTSGMVGTTVTYTVAAGTYTSLISQVDANNKALADITANGQNYANTNGTCVTPCTTGNCSGESKKCVNNVCETGTIVYTSSVKVSNKLWECTYHYVWSDSSISQDYVGYSSTPCESSEPQ